MGETLQGDQEQVTGYDAVLRMRDEFLQLVSAYNAVGEYNDAADAQAMAVALNEFEDRHIITSIAWPPRVENDEHGTPQLVEVQR